MSDLIAHSARLFNSDVVLLDTQDDVQPAGSSSPSPGATGHFHDAYAPALALPLRFGVLRS
jgi:hypothetical protein